MRDRPSPADQLTEAFRANPARFSTRPTPPKIPQVVYINEPALVTQIN